MLPNILSYTLITYLIHFKAQNYIYDKETMDIRALCLEVAKRLK